MFTLWSDIDRLFNRSLSDWMVNSRSDDEAFRGFHRMNLIDSGDSLKFIAELPGVADKDVNLSVHQDTLTLSAKRNIAHDEDNTVYLSERENYDVQRSIALPVHVDAASVKATLKNGLLTVVLPKLPESKPQQIAIHS